MRSLRTEEPPWKPIGHLILYDIPTANIAGIELMEARVESPVCVAGVKEIALGQRMVQA